MPIFRLKFDARRRYLQNLGGIGVVMMRCFDCRRPEFCLVVSVCGVGIDYPRHYYSQSMKRWNGR